MSSSQNSAGLYAATSGAVSRMQALDVVTNNLANVNTTSFKRDMVGFEVQLNGAANTAGPGIIKMNATLTDQSQGSLHATGNPLDVAITGPGFFRVETPQGVAFTRQGNFSLDHQGNLVTGTGLKVLGEGGAINIATPEAAMTIAGDGTVQVDGSDIGRINLVDFPEKDSLIKTGHGLFQPKPDIEPVPVDNPQLTQGALESSNVKLIEEMTRMISYQREYETFQRMIKTYSDLAAKANELGSF